MAWVDPQRLLLLASGAAMLLLGATLAFLDFSKLVNRAFAAFLAVRGTSLLLPQVSGGARWAEVSLAVQPYFTLALVPTALYFACRYPRPRGPLGWRGGGWATLAAIVLLCGLYFWDHSIYYTVEPGVAAVPALQAHGGSAPFRYASFGPLVAVGIGGGAFLSALSIVFVRDYLRSEPGRQRTSFFLVAAGFVLNGVFDGCRQLVVLWRLVEEPGGFPWADWGWAVAVLPSLSLPFTAAAIGLMLAHRFRNRGQERALESRLLVAAALAAATGLSSLLMRPGSEFFTHPLTLVLLGLWRLSLPILVTVALLRYSLFDIDLKVRAAAAWSIVAAIFGGTAFFVSELLEGQVAARTGNLGGLAAAAVLTVAIKPLSVLGRRTAEALMPGVKDLAAVSKETAVELYRQQFLMLQEDGILSPKERASLDSLRSRLGLSEAKARSIERAPAVVRPLAAGRAA